MKQDLKCYPCQIVTRHELYNPDYVKRFHFCQCSLNQCRNRQFLVNIIAGDEAGFSLNGEVTCPNVH